ncbi:unnamed protein product [Brugia timori]|uniref:Peptidase_M13_N domain-containing protein n=1 Tax=Brugia timori TaxID=42155 RepID=A0A0R3QT43_9BILA|nr:unnamed protein product [Brugia timori]
MNLALRAIGCYTWSLRIIVAYDLIASDILVRCLTLANLLTSFKIVSVSFLFQQMDNNQTAEKPKNTNLVCNENIAHRKSPELFPENVPGAWDMNRTLTVAAGDFKSSRFRTELDTQDVRLVNELGQFSADQLMEYIRNLQNSAYTLGIEEGKVFANIREAIRGIEMTDDKINDEYWLSAVI